MICSQKYPNLNSSPQKYPSGVVQPGLEPGTSQSLSVNANHRATLLAICNIRMYTSENKPLDTLSYWDRFEFTAQLKAIVGVSYDVRRLRRLFRFGRDDSRFLLSLTYVYMTGFWINKYVRAFRISGWRGIFRPWSFESWIELCIQSGLQTRTQTGRT